MKNSFKVFLLFLSSIVLASCCCMPGFLSKIIPGNEAPEDYNPIFLTNVKSIKTYQPKAPSLVISKIEPNKSNMVKVYLHLVDSNKTFISGASTAEFKKLWCELYDSSGGVINKIPKYTVRESDKRDRRPKSIAIVMDHSGSMCECGAEAVQSAVSNFLKNKNPDDYIALVKYDHRVKVEVPLTSDSGELQSKFQKNGLTGFGGSTATLNGIDAGLNEVLKSGQNYDRIIMVFTDGMDNSSSIKKESVIARARSTNSIICTVDYGFGINKDFMEDLAHSTGGTYHHIYKPKEFDFIFNDIYNRLLNFYILEYQPLDFGVHNVKVRFCSQEKKLTAEGYYKTLTAERNYDNTPYVGLVTLLNVYFDTDKSTLKPESEDAIQYVVNLMKSDMSKKIELQGHTDSQNNTKDPNYNLKLSQQRAEAVRKALLKKGIEENRIIAKGFGDTQPIADNETEEGRAKNRRTEFVIIE